MVQNDLVGAPLRTGSRLRRLGRGLAAAATTALLVVAGGVGAAMAAPPYVTEATVTDIQFVKTEIRSGSHVEMTANWKLPDNPTSPAGFTIDLTPGELSGRGDTFQITAEDSGAVIANCVATATQVQCDFDEGYITENPRNLSGNVHFWVRVDKQVTDTSEEHLTVGEVTIPITVTPPGGPCTSNCEFEWGYQKDGGYNYGNNTINWYLHVAADEDGMEGGLNVEVRDTPGPNQRLVVSEDSPRLERTNVVGVNAGGYVRPKDWQTVPRSEYTLEDDGTVKFVTEEGYFYQVYYRTEVLDGGAAGTYSNQGEFIINGRTDGSAGQEVRYAGGGGTGIGDNVGVFSITKRVDGTAENLPDDLVFTGSYEVTTPAGDVLPGTFELAADGTWESGEFPRGSTVHLTEVKPTSPANIDWEDPQFSQNDFVLEGGKLTEIVLTNTANVQLGGFSAVKSLEGSQGALALVPTDTEFVLDYSYPAGPGFPAGSGSLTIGADGTAVDSPALPVGAVVTVSEQVPGEIAGIEWGTPVISPATFSVEKDTRVEVKVTNPVTETNPPGQTPRKPVAESPGLPVTGAGDGSLGGVALAGVLLAAGALLIARRYATARH